MIPESCRVPGPSYVVMASKPLTQPSAPKSNKQHTHHHHKLVGQLASQAQTAQTPLKALAP